MAADGSLRVRVLQDGKLVPKDVVIVNDDVDEPDVIFKKIGLGPESFAVGSWGLPDHNILSVRFKYVARELIERIGSLQDEWYACLELNLNYDEIETILVRDFNEYLTVMAMVKPAVELTRLSRIDSHLIGPLTAAADDISFSGGQIPPRVAPQKKDRGDFDKIKDFFLNSLRSLLDR